MSARRAWIALVAAAAYAPACFFELGAVVDNVDSGLSGGGGGSGGMGAGGADSGGGSGDASVDAACVCPDLQNAAETCDADQCAIASCDDGFGDCNGVAEDGCETDFNAWPGAAPSSSLLEVSRFDVDPIVDGSGSEWVSVARQAVAELCVECTQEYPLHKPVGVSAQPEDFTAVFRLGWTPSFLYAFVEVRDNDLVDTPSQDLEGVLRPALQDAVELLLDGNNSSGLDGGSGGYDENDRQLFFGLNGSAEDPTEPGVSPNALPRAFTVAKGAGCYTAEIALDWGYIKVSSTNLVMEGDQFGFDLAVNDWDRGSADAGAQFESQLFWKSPGDSYWINTRGFGTIMLGATSIASPP